MAREMDSRESLVGHICKISEIFVSCRHRSHADGTTSKFLDWYLILGVDRETGEEVIRKQYRQLALQLHPDKNKHQKADVAFKLVLEAYSCLSDKTKRRTFDSLRRDSFCTECYSKFKSSHDDNNKENIGTNTGTTYKSSKRFIHAFKELQKRLSEECRVIENCLRATNQSVNGYPVFDPDNQDFYPDYPHLRMLVSGKDVNFSSNGSPGFKRRGNRRESAVYNVDCEVDRLGKTEQ